MVTVISIEGSPSVAPKQPGRDFARRLSNGLEGVRHLKSGAEADREIAFGQGVATILAEHVRPVINPTAQPLTVYYPGAGYDLIGPIAATDAARYVFVDVFQWQGNRPDGVDHVTGIARQLEALVGGLNVRLLESHDPDRVAFAFELAGADGVVRPRELVYYRRRDGVVFVPPEIETGYDVLYVANSPFSILPSLQVEREGNRRGGLDAALAHLRPHGAIVLDNIAAGQPKDFLARLDEVGLVPDLIVRTDASRLDGPIGTVTVAHRRGSDRVILQPLAEPAPTDSLSVPQAPGTPGTATGPTAPGTEPATGATRCVTGDTLLPILRRSGIGDRGSWKKYQSRRCSQAIRCARSTRRRGGWSGGGSRGSWRWGPGRSIA